MPTASLSQASHLWMPSVKPLRIDSAMFGYLSEPDRNLLRDALTYGCTAFLTMEAPLPKNPEHIAKDTGDSRPATKRVLGSASALVGALLLATIDWALRPPLLLLAMPSTAIHRSTFSWQPASLRLTTTVTAR
jgi:hypothetical protein